MSIFSLIPTLMTILGSLPKALAAIQFLVKAINDAEATGQTGDQKLAAVLNDFEAFLLAAAPTWAGEFQTIAADIEAVVGDVVGLYNDFAHAGAATKPVAVMQPVIVQQVVAAPAPPAPPAPPVAASSLIG